MEKQKAGPAHTIMFAAPPKASSACAERMNKSRVRRVEEEYYLKNMLCLHRVQGTDVPLVHNPWRQADAGSGAGLPKETATLAVNGRLQEATLM